MARLLKRHQADWLMLHIAIPLAYGLLRLIGLSLRKRRSGAFEAFDAAFRSGRRYVIAFWHDDSFYMLYLPRLVPPEVEVREICIMASPGRDGQFIAKFLAMAGMATVRGSASRRGGRALLELIESAAQGSWPAMAVDGSKHCPRFTAQDGALTLAARTGLPVLPIAARAGKSWAVGSGDRIEIPCPFTSFTLAFGEPIAVEPDADKERIEQLRQELERQLRELKGLA